MKDSQQASNQVPIHFPQGTVKHKAFWTTQDHLYWIVTRCKIEIVIIRVVEGTVPALLISWICHFLQFRNIDADNGSDEHPNRKDRADDSAEQIGLYALFCCNWQLLCGLNWLIGLVDGNIGESVLFHFNYSIQIVQIIIQMTRKTNYHQVSYWEDRYKQSICEWYEWLATPNQLSSLFQSLGSNKKILQLGSGSSNLCEKLASMEHEVTAVDFSKQLIKHRTRTNSNDKITYIWHNIQQKLPFADEEYDVIIQKNTLDCLFCQQNFMPNLFRCMKECFRVLKSSGKMISITHGKEKNRKFFYRNRFSPFSIQVQPLINKSKSQPNVLIFQLSKSGQGQGEQGNNSQQENEEQENKENSVSNANQQKQQNKSQQNNDQEPENDNQNSGNKSEQAQPQKEQQYEFDQQ